MASGDNAGFQRGKNAFARMTPEQRAENGRKGGLTKREATRRRKEMRETLDILLNMPMKKGKTYYVKVRAFKVVEGNKYYGAYSKKLKVKVK